MSEPIFQFSKPFTHQELSTLQREMLNVIAGGARRLSFYLIIITLLSFSLAPNFLPVGSSFTLGGVTCFWMIAVIYIIYYKQAMEKLRTHKTWNHPTKDIIDTYSYYKDKIIISSPARYMELPWSSVDEVSQTKLGVIFLHTGYTHSVWNEQFADDGERAEFLEFCHAKMETA